MENLFMAHQTDSKLGLLEKKNLALRNKISKKKIVTNIFTMEFILVVVSITNIYLVNANTFLICYLETTLTKALGT